jgi:NH3-dependent NAD+ synthetase
MSRDEKAREYAAKLRELLTNARRDGLVFAVSGGRRTAYTLTVTIMPETINLQPEDQTNG